MKKSCLLVLSLLLVTSTWSAVTLPNVIGNDMVLQRDLPVPIWGWAEPGKNIRKSFAGQNKNTTTRRNQGRVDGETRQTSCVNFNPSRLCVKGTNEIKLQNILVGEVWICSGQSNMEWSVKQSLNAQRGNCRC